MTAPLRLTWSRDLPATGPRRAEWNELALTMERPEVFYTWEWAQAVANAFGTGLEPWIGTAHEGEKIVGVAALARPSPSEAVFLAGNTADYCDFISLPGKREELVSQVLENLKEQGVRRLTLANLPANSASVQALEASRSFRTFVRDGYECAQVRLGTAEERKQLADMLLKKKMLRRSLAAMEKLGRVTLQHSGREIDASALDEFFVMHVGRFLRTARVSNLVAPERRRFLSELARLLGEQGWFDLMTLRCGERVVGYNFGFQFSGSWFWYQPALENELEENSPGFCLLAKIIEEACSHPEVEMVDMGLGAEGYKERFANAERKTLYVTLSRSALTHWKAKARYRTADAIKRQAGLESLARRLQKGVSQGSQRLRRQGVVSTLDWTAKRLGRFVASRDKVVLFRWTGGREQPGQTADLSPLTWNILARAAMRHWDDQETLSYLLRAADRLQSKMYSGYALMGPDGEAQHFAWAAPYEDFPMAELRTVLKAPAQNSVMIFDCWTPKGVRGQRLYGRAVSQLAARLSAQGAEVWIFSASANPASLGGLRATEFEPQFSLVRQKALLWSRVRKIPEIRGTAAVPKSL